MEPSVKMSTAVTADAEQLEQTAKIIANEKKSFIGPVVLTERFLK